MVDVKGGDFMAVSKAQRAAADKWDAANMAYQSVKVPKTLLEQFKAACAARGNRVNTVLREAMESYVADTPNAVTMAAMQEADEITTDPSVPGYTDVDELLAELKS